MSQQRIRELETELRRLKRAERKKKGARLGLSQRKGMGCRDRDEELKKQRGYTNPSSFVRRDGSEKLVGEDWMKRLEQLYRRSGGTCERVRILGREHVVGCCFTQPSDPHHIVKRSVRRDDRLANLAALSRACHDAEDPRKPKWSPKRPAA